MPPTNASSSSTITSFSWWQCIIRVHESSWHWIFVPRVEPLARGLHARRAAAGRPAPARPPTRSRAPGRARRSRPAARAPGVAVRGPGSKSGSRCQEQTWTWRCAPRIASAIRGSALAPSISTSIALPCARRRGRLRPQAFARRRERGELPVAAQSPHVVMDHRALDAVADGGVHAVENRDPHVFSRTRYCHRPIWPQISPPRSAWPPSVSRCPCSRTIFDPAQMRERLAALETEMGASGLLGRP